MPLTRARSYVAAAVAAGVVLLGVVTAGVVVLGDPAAEPDPGSRVPAPPTTGAAAPRVDPDPADDVRRALARLERRSGSARIGLVAVDTATGAQVSFRPDVRFALASTVKLPLAAVVLDRASDADPDRRVTWTARDLVSYSPVTEAAVAQGLTVRELVDAALVDSDNTAADLLFAEAGGPAAVDRWLAAYGDRVSSVDRTEPELNDWRPGERRDTTTPRALAGLARGLLLGDLLDPTDRRVLLDAMTASTTGLGLVRAGVPRGWRVADRSGTASFGTRNDVAVVFPPGRAPWVVVVMTSHAGRDTPPDDRLVARATRALVRAWR